MASTLLPTTQEICSVAGEELSRAGGTILDLYDDGERLFLRSVLPTVREVRPGDAVKGGVALITTDEEIRVHPYTFRQVCRNGAIAAAALQTRCVDRVEPDVPIEAVEAVVEELREAIRDCSTPEAFSITADRMRSAGRQEADLMLHLAPMLSRLPREHAARLFAAIEGTFTQQRDTSMFGLVNAVTSVARDEPDPQVRWRLEELGGGVLALVCPDVKPGGVAADPLPV